MLRDDTDVATIDGLFRALYESISGPPGGQDFDRSRRIHHPDARMVRTGVGAGGRPFAASFSIPDYEANAGSLLAEMHFHEVETARRTVRFGTVAQVYSAYEARTAPVGGTVIKRGMNLAHLYHDGSRWWLMHMIWDDERDGVTIPAEIFERWEDIG